jgi:tRNA(fMet)-specific endonuclease VapC
MTYSRMLDTNTVSMIVRGGIPSVDRQLLLAAPDDLCISAITQGELLFGLAKAPDATRIARLVHAALDRLAILPWTTEVAATYGDLRAEMRRMGRALGALDMLIAAHALSIGATLVTSDSAFRHVPRLAAEDWSRP